MRVPGCLYNCVKLFVPAVAQSLADKNFFHHCQQALLGCCAAVQVPQCYEEEEDPLDQGSEMVVVPCCQNDQGEDLQMVVDLGVQGS